MNPLALSTLPFVERFFTFPLLDSTNTMARSITDVPRSGIMVVQADRQAKGRGRNGNVFFSESAHGLWVSIITPVVSIGEHFVHNRALSVALCDAIEATSGVTSGCSIKWPNDIFWNDKKICGILLENHPSDPNTLVLGFGCNITMASEEFPEELRSIATSMLMETGKRYSRSTVLKTILLRYNDYRAGDPERLHEKYVARLYGLHRAVTIDDRRGIFEGVEIDGRLRLRKAQELIYITAGHLRFLPDEVN